MLSYWVSITKKNWVRWTVPLSIAGSHHSVFGVPVARIKSAGSRRIPGFFYINFTAPANRKKTLLPVHSEGRLIQAETQLSALGKRVYFALSG